MAQPPLSHDAASAMAALRSAGLYATAATVCREHAHEGGGGGGVLNSLYASLACDAVFFLHMNQYIRRRSAARCERSLNCSHGN